MRVATAFTPLALALASTVVGDLVTVKVGANGNTFDPENISAKAGDQLQFVFYPQNHDVVQGNFDSPCVPRDQGFYSGMGFSTRSGPANKTYVLDFTSEMAANPIYIYCSVSDHCQDGMVAIINGNQGNTIAQYKARAASASNNVSPTATAAVSGSVSSLSATATSSSSTGSATSTGSSSSATTTSGSGSGSSTARTTGAAATSKSSSTSSSAAGPTMAAGQFAAGLVAGAALLAL